MRTNIIKKPKHYLMQGEETMIKMVRKYGIEATINFFELSAFKYGDRAKFKKNETQDLQKRKECLNIAYKLSDIRDEVLKDFKDYDPYFDTACAEAVSEWRDTVCCR